MTRLQMKKYNVILTKKQRKFDKVKLINMKLLQGKKHYHLIKVE